MDNSKDAKIIKFQKGFHVNIGVFLMIIIILYILFHIFSSLTKKDILAYEINLGTIVEKNFYQGLALRDEVVVKSDKDGYINYETVNKSRVGAKSTVYGLDVNNEIVSKMIQQKANFRQLGPSELRTFTPTVESFLGNFNGIDYSTVSSFKDDVSDYLLDVLSREVTNDFKTEIEAAKARGTYIEYRPAQTGFLVYSVDGYEDKSLTDISPSDFSISQSASTNLRMNEFVFEGDPVYKLIISDDWQMLIPIKSEDVEVFSEITTIKVRFIQDSAITWANLQIINQNDQDYILLSFDDSMERYADRRIINVELLFDETVGLKLPNTAICEKEFFAVPKSYFYIGNNSYELGFMIKKSDGKDTFETPTIYYSTDEYYYIDDEFVNEGDEILMENSLNTYKIGTNKDKLIGAYNINKGYAVFKPIEILYQNEKYTIVKTKSHYGLALYDHIALNAEDIEGNEIL